MREYIEGACDCIDAAIFSGDILYCDDDRKDLKEYVQRWERAIAEHEAAEQTETNKRLSSALTELVALVRGECPSLLDEDSGGNSRLSMEIDAALEPNS